MSEPSAPPLAEAALPEAPWSGPAGEVAGALAVDPQRGLDAREVEERRARFGGNELHGTARPPAWRRFLAQFADPLVYLLLVAVVISFAAWWIEGAEGAPVDVIVILAILVLNAVLGFVQENKAEDAVAALADMTAAGATVLRDGRLATVEATDLVPGDVLVLSEGDSVGADARLMEATSLQVQESALTGESAAVTKAVDPVDADASIGDRTGMVFKGTAVVSGVGRAVVTATGMRTEMGRIATMLDETESEPSPLDREISRISRMLGIAVVAIAVVVMAAMILVNGARSLEELVEVLLLGVSLAVAAVPEGLPAILSVVLAIGVRKLAAHNAVMKQLHSVETLGSASVIASDKTGTLTRNEMTLTEIVTASGRVVLTGTGYSPDGTAEVEGGDDAADEARRVLTGGVRANNAQLDRASGEGDREWTIQGDPTEAAFLVAQHKLDGVAERVRRYRREGEVPFSSERKMMSVLDRSESDERRIFSKGAPDVLLERCTSLQVGGATRPLTPEDRARQEDLVAELSSQGYRTLAVAWREADPDRDGFDDGAEHDLTYLGMVGIVDPPRDEAKAALAEAHRAGIRTVMITGDHPATASRIAGDLGIVESTPARAVTGRELDALDDAALSDVARAVSVYARVAPEHKLRLVDALQADGQIVAMTGDGVNDAPALKSSDIGVAMGITGTEVTKQAATMILADDNYATIVRAVRQGRVIFDNIKKFLRYLLSSNMGEVCTIFFGVLLGTWLGLKDPTDPTTAVVPLLATQILWVNLVTDSGPALAMGVDPEIDDVMARRPRRPDERIIDRHMWSRILFIGLVMAAVTLAVFDACLPGGLFTVLADGVPADQQLAVARTTAFTTLVFAQLFNALNSRSDTGSAFHRMFSNPWLWASFAFVTVAQVLVVEVPFLQVAFGTASLDAGHWALAIGASAVVLIAEEIVKAVRRARAAS
ncbi:cation-translocating P-type ATPase [Brachybacterium huguangmaarense]